MRYFTSDIHAFHKGVMNFCADTRDGQDEEEMTEIWVHNLNETVGRSDELYILGDFSFGNYDRTQQLIRKIKCPNKHIILGNHDRLFHKNDHLHRHFRSVSSYKEIRLNDENKTKVVMSHFPMMEWNQCSYGAIMLHGHCHGGLGQSKYRIMDVGVDARSDKLMIPFSEEEILKIMETREIMKHHGGRSYQDGL
jgi:calcineurin-like phosphoesterase family protein